jgi:hypothetical protein
MRTIPEPSWPLLKKDKQGTGVTFKNSIRVFVARRKSQQCAADVATAARNNQVTNLDNLRSE